MGVPLFARGDVAGLFSLSKREAGYFNAGAPETGRGDVLAGLGGGRERDPLRADAGLDRADADRSRAGSSRCRRTSGASIARELHDEAGQALVSLRYGLRLLEQEIDAAVDASARGVAELMQRTDAVIDGLHRLAADLRPASLDHLGLEAALRQYSGSTASECGLTVHFKARGLDRRAPSGGSRDGSLSRRPGGDHQRRAPLRRDPGRHAGGAVATGSG